MSRPGASGARAGRGTAARLWGDGFAADGVAASGSMTDWDRCSSDEYALLFPRLLPADGRLPAVVLAHLETCVAVRALRLAGFGAAVPDLRSRRPVQAEAARSMPDWFVADGLAASVLRRLGLLRVSPERLAEERRLLAVLDDVLHRVQAGSPPPWTEDREAWFAFGSGIHPAYLWPESALAPARGYTAAWLGHLDRGRRALVPEAVAEYLVDAVLDRSRTVDRSLAAMVGPIEDARRLHRAATRRLAGDDPTVGFARGRLRGVASVGDLRPAAPLREDALEHA